MSAPVRLQLSRRKGYRLQDHSQACNGLPAVNVARPSKWGNPYKIGTCLIPDARAAVDAFSANLPMCLDVSDLRGKNLACWCSLGQPCHADVLLRLANAAPNIPPRR
jgi:hypothetical protein